MDSKLEPKNTLIDLHIRGQGAVGKKGNSGYTPVHTLSGGILMDIAVVIGSIVEQEAQAIVVNLFEGVTLPGGATGAVDAALDGAIRALLSDGDFRGKQNEVAVLYPAGKIRARRVLIVGLGKAEALTLDTVRQSAAAVARKARELGVTHLHSIVHGAGIGGLDPERAAEAVVEGTLLGLYRFQELKTQLGDARPDLTALTLVESSASKRGALARGAQSGAAIAESTMLARDLINRPANLATPSHIAAVAREMAAGVGLRFEEFEKAELEALGMGAFLSVNKGGNEPARMVVLEHNAERDELPRIVLVGKGITFDTGGISLKPAEKMEAMKGDMSGAAAVVAALRAAALLKLPVRVVGLLMLTENMPDATATRPGDVVRSLKGLTVEIINTDAEGRLVLADGLSYAGHYAPQAIFDIATLTGGRIVALGDQAAAVMGSDALIERLREAGQTVGERVWPLPLYQEYGEQIKSEVADVKNTGGREASTIIGGMFLSKFVPEGIPWVHIDIAGLSLSDKDRPYLPKGATAFGARLLVEMLRGWGN